MGVTCRAVEGSHASTHFAFGEERQVVGLGRKPGSEAWRSPSWRTYLELLPIFMGLSLACEWKYESTRYRISRD